MSMEAAQAQLAQMQLQAEQLRTAVAQAWQASALMWRITAAVVVLFMQLGFSLIEAGTVRYKNTRNIMIKNALDTGVSAIAFWLFGYAFAFGEGCPFIGWAAPDGKVAFAQVLDPVSFFFQFVFVATSATIFAGAVAERTQISAYLAFNFVLAAFIYPVVAHMLWSDSGYFSVESTTSLLGTVGVLDNAGSMVVHVTGGVTSLVAAWFVGPRLGRFDINGKVIQFQGHSLVFIAAGTLAIWAGFLGFNGGSVVLFAGENPSDYVGRIRSSVMNTSISAAFAGVTAFTATFWSKDPYPEHTFNAVLGGLVAACATSSLVYTYAAAVIGVVSGLVYLLGVWLVTSVCGIDDPVHAAAVHLFCGAWGSLAAGLLAAPDYIQQTYHLPAGPVPSCGLFYGCGPKQLAVQVLALLFLFVWVGLTSFLFFLSLNSFGMLRVSRQEEEVGLDIAFHGAGQFGGDVDIATAEEGGVDGRKLAAMQTRLATWRKLRHIAKAQRQEAAGQALPSTVHMSASRTPLAAGSASSNSSGSGSGGGARAGLGSGPSSGGRGLLGSLARPGPSSGASSGSGGGSGGALGKLGALGRPLGLLGSNARGAAHSAFAGRCRDVWQRDLENTALGSFSLAMYEANYVMEDAVEVHSSADAVFIGVHDGHNGSEAAEFVRDSLWPNIRARCRAAGLGGGAASAECISAGFLDTEAQFTDVVREAFDDTAPHLATVGACTAAVLVTRKGLWAANVGDCRAVLGQVRVEESGSLAIRAVQLTQEHNLADKEIREAYVMQHMDMRDAVMHKRGAYRVKGRVTVTRCFGDLYLKSHEFNREPLVSRFRIPEPFNPPMLTAQPAVTSRAVTPHDSFVIVASDGLFELLPNEDAVRIVATHSRKDVARVLTRAALERAAARKEVAMEDLIKTPSGQRRNFHDDITVVVFFFDHEALHRTPHGPRLWARDTSYRGGSSTKGSKAAGVGGTAVDLTSILATTNSGDAAGITKLYTNEPFPSQHLNGDGSERKGGEDVMELKNK